MNDGSLLNVRPMLNSIVMVMVEYSECISLENSQFSSDTKPPPFYSGKTRNFTKNCASGVIFDLENGLILTCSSIFPAECFVGNRGHELHPDCKITIFASTTAEEATGGCERVISHSGILLKFINSLTVNHCLSNLYKRILQ